MSQQAAPSAADPTEPDLGRLRDLVRRLRAPDGCPWDRKQRLEDLRAYLLEEAHEAADGLDRAVAGEGWGALREELGDLLFQVVFISELANEQQRFTLAEVIDGIHSKMVDRHPHVFGGAESLDDAEEVLRSWESRKVTKAAETDRDRSLLAGVPRSAPALVGGLRLTQKAAGVGFDWPEISGALAKTHEELAELEEVLELSQDDAGTDARATAFRQARVQEEMGDLLFAITNVARKAGVDPEAALAAANNKFRRRFAGVERDLRNQDRSVVEASLEEMDEAWERVKQAEAPDAAASPAARRR